MTSVARREHDDSGEYSDASQDIDHNNSGNDAGQPESDYDSQGSDSERSDGDQDTQETERRVDDDEDRSNPQYIPKRGTFYEHDDRTAASGEESSNTTSETASEKKEGSETPAERRRAPRKSDVINKWSHDKYNENEQMPKSRDELVAIYGYDIRNEDAPPHARRNRRYGRGPNKYTRTWEDEEAYRRQSAAQPQPRKPPNPEDFPELDPSRRQSKRTTRGPRPRSKSQPASNESLENGSNQLRRNASIKSPKGKNERPVKPAVNKNAVKPSPRPNRVEPKDKMPPLENLTITTNVNTNNQGQPQRKVNATVAQQRPVPTEQAKRKPLQQPPQPNNVAPNKSPPQPSPPLSQQKPQAQASQPPAQPAAAGEARGGSKRYSSLRQRPLAETYSPQTQQQQQQQQQQQPQQQQQQIRYNEYPAGAPAPHQGSPVPQLQPPPLMHQQVHRTGVPPQHGPSPPHVQLPQPQHSQQVRIGLLEQQQLVSHPHPLHNMPQPHAIGQLQATQGYAPPAMMPAQYMQPAGGGGSFGGAMYAQPHQPAAYPMYPPHHNYQARPLGPKHEPARAIIQNYHQPGPAPPELLATQAGGVTYYNCVEQEPPQQLRAQRRPTAAIPIVKPAPERAANSSEKDNIDRIVENMFVRKPWPTTHGADSKDKPQENRSFQEPPSKDSSQPNSLTSSSISTDSKPSETKEERAEERTGEERREEKESQESEPQVVQETIETDA